jgi:Zn-dependent protease
MPPGMLGSPRLFFAFVVAVWCHELGHAFAGWLIGDKLARQRFTLWPLANLDPLLSLALPALTTLLLGVPVGMGRPLLVSRERPILSAAGPAANAALAVCVLPFAAHPFAWAVAVVSLAMGLLNLLPIPGLDGSKFIT